MLRKLLAVSMMIVVVTVACGSREPETTTYTNSAFGYSITLIDPFTVLEELNEKAEVRIGTSEGTAIQIMVFTGAEPLETDQLDERIKRLNEMTANKFPDGTKVGIMSSSNLTLGSGQIARITSWSATVPDACERQEYRLNIIHEGRLFDIWAMPCAEGSGIKDIKTIINSISLSPLYSEDSLGTDTAEQTETSADGTKTKELGHWIPDLGANHISRGESHPPYNSVPATSGWHYSDAGAPARWAVYDEFITDPVLVHNLEHAGVGIHYNCPGGCDELIAKLAEIAERYFSRSNPMARKVIMSPYPGMDSTIALTAWNYLDSFDEFDEERIVTFIEDHMNASDAPEPLAR